MRALLIFTVILFFVSPAAAQMLSVKGNNVNLRSGAGTKYPVKWEYGNGFPLKVIQKKGEWLEVSDFENDRGWIHQDLVTSTPHMIVKKNRNSKKKINIRSGPSTKNKIVGMAYYGVVFKTLDQKAEWAKVRHESGLEGWIHRDLLWGF